MNEERLLSKEEVDRIIDMELLESEQTWISNELPKLEANKFQHYKKCSNYYELKSSLEQARLQYAYALNNIKNSDFEYVEELLSATKHLKQSFYNMRKVEWLLELNRSSIFKAEEEVDVPMLTDLMENEKDQNYKESKIISPPTELYVTEAEIKICEEFRGKSTFGHENFEEHFNFDESDIATNSLKVADNVQNINTLKKSTARRLNNDSYAFKSRSQTQPKNKELNRTPKNQFSQEENVGAHKKTTSQPPKSSQNQSIIFSNPPRLLSSSCSSYRLKNGYINDLLRSNGLNEIFHEIKQLARHKSENPYIDLNKREKALSVLWDDFLLYLLEPIVSSTVSKGRIEEAYEEKVFLKYLSELKSHYNKNFDGRDYDEHIDSSLRTKRYIMPTSYDLDKARKIREEDKKKESDIRLLSKYQKYEEIRDNQLNINPGHREEDLPVKVPSFLSIKLKPNQVDGVQFLWKNLVMKDHGCVLAHAMGLGKTLQVITFLYTLYIAGLQGNIKKDMLKCPKTLILCPISVKRNWRKEFEKWIEPQFLTIFRIYEFGRKGREDVGKKIFDLKEWYQLGGIMIMNYDGFRELLENYAEDDEKDSTSYIKIKHCLLNPGPDLIIADEAHIIKNPNTKISYYAKETATPYRICLSGYPIQNNLKEFWCMVDFAIPNFLGSESDFKVTYEAPIQDVIYRISDESQKYKAYCKLFSLVIKLKDVVLRKDASFLEQFLPQKKEFFICCHLSEPQRKLYKDYLDYVSSSAYEGTNSFLAKGYILSTICNHPLVFKKKRDLDTIKDGFKSSALENGNFESFYKTNDYDDEEADNNNLDFIQQVKKSVISNSLKPFEKTMTLSNLDLSIKFKVLMTILKSCVSKKEKVLVFSSSLIMLDIIQAYFIDCRDSSFKHCRIDGSVPIKGRNRIIEKFNSDTNEYNILLITINTGSMGINLTSANHVVLFDVGWNPSHGEQAIGRIFRFGQLKNTFVYRLYTESTWEEALIKNNEMKVHLSKLVIDRKENKSGLDRREFKQYFKLPKIPKGHINKNNFDEEHDVIKQVVESCGTNIAEIKTQVGAFTDFDVALTDYEMEMLKNGYNMDKESEALPQEEIICEPILDKDDILSKSRNKSESEKEKLVTSYNISSDSDTKQVFRRPLKRERQKLATDYGASSYSDINQVSRSQSKYDISSSSDIDEMNELEAYKEINNGEIQYELQGLKLNQNSSCNSNNEEKSEQPINKSIDDENNQYFLDHESLKRNTQYSSDMEQTEETQPKKVIIEIKEEETNPKPMNFSAKENNKKEHIKGNAIKRKGVRQTAFKSRNMQERNDGSVAFKSLNDNK